MWCTCLTVFVERLNDDSQQSSHEPFYEAMLMNRSVYLCVHLCVHLYVQFVSYYDPLSPLLCPLISIVDIPTPFKKFPQVEPAWVGEHRRPTHVPNKRRTGEEQEQE
jgi:hypothetical protein